MLAACTGRHDCTNVAYAVVDIRHNITEGGRHRQRSWGDKSQMILRNRVVYFMKICVL